MTEMTDPELWALTKGILKRRFGWTEEQIQKEFGGRGVTYPANSRDDLPPSGLTGEQDVEPVEVKVVKFYSDLYVEEYGGFEPTKAQLKAFIISKARDGDKIAQSLGGSFDNIIASIYQPHGGSDSFTNLRTPGMGTAKITATPATAGYGEQAKPIDSPKGGFYDSRRGEVAPTPNRTRGVSESEAAGSHYGGDRAQVLSGGKTPKGQTYNNYPSPRRVSGGTPAPAPWGQKDVLSPMIKEMIAAQAPTQYGQPPNPLPQQQGLTDDDIARLQALQSQPPQTIGSEEDEDDEQESEEFDRKADEAEERSKQARFEGNWSYADSLISQAKGLRLMAIQKRRKANAKAWSNLGF